MVGCTSPTWRRGTHLQYSLPCRALVRASGRASFECTCLQSTRILIRLWVLSLWTIYRISIEKHSDRLWWGAGICVHYQLWCCPRGIGNHNGRHHTRYWFGCMLNSGWSFLCKNTCLQDHPVCLWKQKHISCVSVKGCHLADQSNTPAGYSTL